jgi:hypothetical protein
MKQDGSKMKTIIMQTGLRKIGLLLVALLMISSIGFAQGRKLEKIQTLKVAFITDKIDLTSAQAERFWPVYHKYENDVRDLRRSYLTQNETKTKGFSREEAQRYIDDNLDYQEAVIALKRRYKDEFLKIISAKQLSDLYAAEHEFKQMLIQKLRERRARRQ